MGKKLQGWNETDLGKVLLQLGEPPAFQDVKGGAGGMRVHQCGDKFLKVKLTVWRSGTAMVQGKQKGEDLFYGAFMAASAGSSLPAKKIVA